MPSSAKPIPNTSPNVAMKSGHSSPNSNDRIVPVTTPTANSDQRDLRPALGERLVGDVAGPQVEALDEEDHRRERDAEADDRDVHGQRQRLHPAREERVGPARTAEGARDAVGRQREEGGVWHRAASLPSRRATPEHVAGRYRGARMPDRPTERAVAEAAPLETARRAAGARGAGSQDPLVSELRRAGLLPLLVLHFLAREPSYGNQLMERVAELTGGLIAVNPNTMYPLLRSLEQQGLVAGEWEHPERRSRRFYRLTPAGEAERDRLAGRARAAPRRGRRGDRRSSAASSTV